MVVLAFLALSSDNCCALGGVSPLRRRPLSSLSISASRARARSLSFSTQNVVKSSLYTAGTWAVHSDSEYLQGGTFRWEPYWLATEVQVTMTSAVIASVTHLVVVNEWGDEVHHAVSCSQ